MHTPYTLRRASQRGFSLIELLIVVAMLAALGGGVAYMIMGGKDSNGQKRMNPKQRAQGVACQSNLQQIRMSVKYIHDGDEENKFPASLSDIKFPKDSLRCPDGKEPYVYDAAAGEVHCVHPGHEKL